MLGVVRSAAPLPPKDQAQPDSVDVYQLAANREKLLKYLTKKREETRAKRALFEDWREGQMEKSAAQRMRREFRNIEGSKRNGWGARDKRYMAVDVPSNNAEYYDSPLYP